MIKIGIIPANKNKTYFTYESGTYGSPSGAGEWAGLVDNVDTDNSEGVTEQRYHGMNTRNPSMFIPGVRDYGGTLSYKVQDFRFLMFALGNNTDAATGSPAFFTHTIAELEPGNPNPMTSGATAPFMSFGLESAQEFATGACLTTYWKGAMVDSFTLSANSREPLQASVGFISQDCVWSSGLSTLTNGGVTRRPYMWSDTLVNIPSGTAIAVENWELSINNNIARDEAHICNGSREITTPVALERAESLSLTMPAESTQAAALYGLYKSGGNAVQHFGIKINNVHGNAASGISWICGSNAYVKEFNKPNPAEGVNKWELVLVPKSLSAIIQDDVVKYSAW